MCDLCPDSEPGRSISRPMVPNIQESIGAYEARHAACSCEAMTPRPGSSGRAGADGAGGPESPRPDPPRHRPAQHPHRHCRSRPGPPCKPVGRSRRGAPRPDPPPGSPDPPLLDGAAGHGGRRRNPNRRRPPSGAAPLPGAPNRADGPARGPTRGRRPRLRRRSPRRRPWRSPRARSRTPPGSGNRSAPRAERARSLQ